MWRAINKYLPTYLIIGISGIPFLLNDIALVVFFLFILIRVFQTKTQILWVEVISVLVFVILFCLQFYVYGNFSIMTLIGTVLRMLSGLFYLKVEGKEFVPKYVQTMRFICIISMIAYLLFNIIPGLYHYLAQNSFENLGEWSSTSTIFIYQFSPINLITRNIGPFWEPGVFGIFINISLFFRIFVLREKLNRSLFEILSVITTFSTTNYLILFVLLTCYYAFYSEHKIKLVYLVSLVTLSVFVFFNSAFLSDKVITQFEEAKIIESVNSEPRFVSIIRDYDDLQKTWVTGTGFYLPNRFYYSPWRKYSNCGFTDILVKLGILGSLLYFILLYRGTTKIFEYANNGSVIVMNIVFFLTLFIAGISEMVYPMSLFFGIAILGASRQ
jgi:hypothetical protein